MRFTVRRPPSGEVSPCCHRPSGGDVACSIDVGVAPSGVAGLALEDRLALAVPRCHMPARGATLRRVRSRNLLDPAQSLVLQTRDKLTPLTSKNCAVEAALLRKSSAGFLGGAARGTGHCRNIEGLDSDHFEATREVSGGRSRPSLSGDPSHGLSAWRCHLSFFRGGGSPAWPGPVAAAAPSTASTHLGSGRVRAAVRRWTAQPTRQLPGRCPPHCRLWDRRSIRGCGRTRHASGQPDHESPDRTSPPPVLAATGGTAPSRPWAPIPEPKRRFSRSM